MESDDETLPLAQLAQKKRRTVPDHDDEEDDVPISSLKKPKIEASGDGDFEEKKVKERNPDRDFQDEEQRRREERRAAKLAARANETEAEREERRRRKQQRREELAKAAAAGGISEAELQRQRNERKLEEERRKRKALKMKAKLKIQGRAASGNGVKKENNNSKGAPTFKEATRVEKLDLAMKAFKWWEAPELEEGILWRYLEHNGIIFPPEHKVHGIKLLYEGEPLDLSPEQEELATLYAAMPDDGPQLGDPATRPIFQKNFWSDFKQVLDPKGPWKGKNFDVAFKKFDFSLIKEYLNQQKILKKTQTDSERQKTKDEKEAAVLLHGYAIVDGHLERVGNMMMEPPGLFRGRGKHPKTGLFKRRVFPGQVTINIGENARPPKCPLPGHAWMNVQHDPTVTWMATWNENIMGSNKYVQLAASSSFKGKSDRDKYNKAATLKGYINKIREDYGQNLWKKSHRPRQIATAMWIIDVLALRVGGEKGEDEADTVGCCSLRVEHLRFDTSGDEARKYTLELEFLGKDSMLFKQEIDFGKYGKVGRRVFKNLVEFCQKKKRSEDVFDQLTPTILNQHLSSLMPGLSAKVFRTYNATETLQNELPKPEAMAGLTVQEKVVLYNAANRKVAILCNHQRTVSHAAAAQLENVNERLDLLKVQRKELKDIYRLLKAGKHKRVPLQSDRGKEKVAAAAARLKKAKDLKAAASTVEEKKHAIEYEEKAKAKRVAAMKIKQSESHLFVKMPSTKQVKGRVIAWGQKIAKLKLDIKDRDENKEVALGTSKINYMDPRVSVAWCKTNEVPIEKIFAKTLRDKFNWAFAVPPDWRFEAPLLQKVEEDDDESDTAVDDTDAVASEA